MRTLVIGDIHGFSAIFDTLLEAVAPTSQDSIITLGDYVDRGPDSRGVLDRLIQRFKTGQLIPLSGNHDLLFTEVVQSNGDRRAWLKYGGVETLVSYGHGPIDNPLSRVPYAHLDFLNRSCRMYHETQTHLFAHANVDPSLPMSEQKEIDLRWTKLEGPVHHYSGKTLVCGHTRQANGRPLVLPGVVCIDTGVYDVDGWLTCLHLETGEYWQANYRQEVRTGRLETPTESGT